MVVLQISVFIHILDRKYHIHTYHMSLILFSSTIWQFHSSVFFSFKFSGEKIHNFLSFFSQIISFGYNLALESQKKALHLTPSLWLPEVSAKWPWVTSLDAWEGWCHRDSHSQSQTMIASGVSTGNWQVRPSAGRNIFYSRKCHWGDGRP